MTSRTLRAEQCRVGTCDAKGIGSHFSEGDHVGLNNLVVPGHQHRLEGNLRPGTSLRRKFVFIFLGVAEKLR